MAKRKVKTDFEFVKNSKYRTAVVKALEGTVRIPTELSADTGIITNHISNTLRQLRERGIVECLNPEDKKGRLYRLTEKGRQIAEKL